ALGQLGADALARHHEPRGPRTPDQARRALRAAAARKEAEADLREAELSVVARDQQVAAKRQLEAAADAVAVDRGHDRDGRRLKPVGQLLEPARTAVRILEAADVGAGRERAVTLAAQPDDACLVVDVGERAREQLGDLRADHVQRRVVQPDRLDHSVRHGRETNRVATKRLEAFADGVFAIAATLLIIDVTADAHGGALGAELRHAWPQYAAYGVSF